MARDESRRAQWAVRAPGGPALFGQSWLPSAPARGAILIVHGLFEHSGRYAATAAALNGGGFAVHAFDYRGHGRSEGRRVHVDSVDEYVADVRAALDEVRRRHPGLPVFLLGHSQGGLVVLKLALEDAAGLAGIVVTSPFLAVHPRSRPSAFVHATARVMRRVAPRLPLPTHIDVSVLSRDPAVGEAYARDPLVSHKASAGWLRATSRAQRDVRARASSLRVPALVMASGEDLLVDPEATRQFALEATPARVDFVWWDGFFHEMLNDVGREQVLARIMAWLEAHGDPLSARIKAVEAGDPGIP
jgi:acylglycerol lipase